MTDPTIARALLRNESIAHALGIRGRAYLNEYISTGSPVDERAFKPTPYFDQASLILACIEKGIVFRRLIMQTVSKASWSTGRMVGKALDRFNGDDPTRHLWHQVEIAPDLHAYRAHSWQ